MEKRTLRAKKLRALLYYYQNGKCAICGKDLSVDFHVHHPIPWRISKRTNVHELQAVCPKCNLEKGGKYEVKDTPRSNRGNSKGY